jgi:hypothetical protein
MNHIIGRLYLWGGIATATVVGLGNIVNGTRDSIADYHRLKPKNGMLIEKVCFFAAFSFVNTTGVCAVSLAKSGTYGVIWPAFITRSIYNSTLVSAHQELLSDFERLE